MKISKIKINNFRLLRQLKNRQKQLKIDLILGDPKENGLYRQLKDLPFSQVKRIYLDKDSLIDDKKDDREGENKNGSKRDDLIKHLFKIEELIHLYDEKGICKKDDKFNEVTKKNEYLFNRVRKVKYKEFQNLYKYLEGYTPFSTQHKIKGAEYDNVLIVLINISKSR